MLDAELLGDYLLGEASVQRREQLEQRIKLEPALADRVKRLEDVTDGLQSLPPAAWEALHDSELAGPQRSERSGLRDRLARGRTSLVDPWAWRRLAPRVSIGLIAAGALFIAGFAVRGLSTTASSGVPPGRELVLAPLAGGPTGVSGVAYIQTSGAEMVLVIAIFLSPPPATTTRPG